jgi:hypothetical protein
MCHRNCSPTEAGKRLRKNREMKEEPTMLLITKDRLSEPTMFMKTKRLADLATMSMKTIELTCSPDRGNFLNQPASAQMRRPIDAPRTAWFGGVEVDQIAAMPKSQVKKHTIEA